MTTSEHRALWLAGLLSTAPADHARAEAALRRLYAAAGFAEPRHFLWFNSPCAASWPVALLAAPYSHVWRQLLSSQALSRDDRERAEAARHALAERLGVAEWQQVLAVVGAPLGSPLRFPPVSRSTLYSAVVEARMALHDDIAAMSAAHLIEDDLQSAEQHFAIGSSGVLSSALFCPTTGHVIAESFSAEYPFVAMAADEEAATARPVPPILSSAWDAARSAGSWWPFEHAVILSDRPAELRLNDRHLLHSGDGPAAVFRDGWKVYAWNGKAVPERWILEPDSIPARELKGFDASFRAHVEARTGTPARPRARRPGPSPILHAPLARDVPARLEQLRAHAGGRLPLLDRYLAGQHREVWSELVALGPDVRNEPHTADALAVACETMRRVEANVRTIVDRLRAMNYQFATAASRRDAWAARAETAAGIDLDQLQHLPRGNDQLGGLFGMLTRARDLLAGQVQKAKREPADATVRAHVAPGAASGQQVGDFEKEYGTLPLSLRAFYEIVGEVNLMGEHPRIAPRDGAIAPDPLVVYGLSDGIVDYDDEDDDEPSVVTIAPDDLHKADTSGGDPYVMAIPDPRADGELLNERHNLFFVDYLRLCFRFGGFPGYDGFDAPAELNTLSDGLLAF